MALRATHVWKKAFYGVPTVKVGSLTTAADRGSLGTDSAGRRCVRVVCIAWQRVVGLCVSGRALVAAGVAWADRGVEECTATRRAANCAALRITSETPVNHQRLPRPLPS